MKDTPIQKALKQIHDNEMLNLSDVKMLLIDLLPYERECIEGAHVDGTTHNHDCEVAGKPKMSAHDYFTQTFKTNPQGGGGRMRNTDFKWYVPNKTHTITQISTDWHFDNLAGVHETFFEVGQKNVVEIEEHQSAGEGDKFYYDVHYADGTVNRLFNIHHVIFKPTNK